MKRLLLLALVCAVNAAQADKVSDARKNQAATLRSLAKQAGLSYPFKEVYLRAFKGQRILEVWANDRKGAKMKRIATFPIAAASGGPGPKRRYGDYQVPEGFYYISGLNPYSSYHLGLNVGYPNASDRKRGEQGNLGGEIAMHGDQKSAGCLAMTDAKIEIIYLLVADTPAGPRGGVRLDIFPDPLPAKSLLFGHAEFGAFWREIAVGYQKFEETRRPPRFTVTSKGAYRFP